MTGQSTKLSDFVNNTNPDNPVTDGSKESVSSCPDTHLKEQDSHSQVSSGDSDPPNDSSGSTGGDTSTTCPYYEEKLQKWRGSIEGKDLSTLKCGHAIDYLGGAVDGGLSLGSAGSYFFKLRIFVEYLVKEKETNVPDATFDDIDDFLEQKAKSGITESTIGGYKTVLTNLYKHMDLYDEFEPNLDWLLIRENIDPSTYNTAEGFEREPLTKSELDQLFDSMNSSRNRLIVMIGVELGPRNTDLSSIEINDLDLEDQKAELTNTKAQRTYELPLSDELSLLLRRWIDVERDAHINPTGDNYLFPGKDGHLSGQSINNIIKDAAEDIGIQEVIYSSPLTERQKESFNTEKDHRDFHRVTTHVLRHTFNNLMDEADLPIEARSFALDHQSPEVTRKFYDHKEDDYQELLSNLFSDLKFIS